MIWLVIGFVVWLGGGWLLFRMIDRGQMKEHVPYGECPALFSLEMIRATVFVFCLLVGVPYAAWLLPAILRGARNGWRRRAAA